MNARTSNPTLNATKMPPRSRLARNPRGTLPQPHPLPLPDPDPEPVPASTSEPEMEPWWLPARLPREFSSLHLGRNREEWGGDFLVLTLSRQDGAEILATGADRFSLERISNRVVTIGLHRLNESGNRWGMHKLSLVKPDRPHVRFLLKDLELSTPLERIGIVGRRRPPDRVTLKITPKKITFRLPPGIR